MTVRDEAIQYLVMLGMAMLFLACVFMCGIGIGIGEGHAAAIKAGVARYVVNPTNGSVGFEYVKAKP